MLADGFRALVTAYPTAIPPLYFTPPKLEDPGEISTEDMNGGRNCSQENRKARMKQPRTHTQSSKGRILLTYVRFKGPA